MGYVIIVGVPILQILQAETMNQVRRDSFRNTDVILVSSLSFPSFDLWKIVCLYSKSYPSKLYTRSSTTHSFRTVSIGLKLAKSGKEGCLSGPACGAILISAVTSRTPSHGDDKNLHKVAFEVSEPTFDCPAAIIH